MSSKRLFHSSAYSTKEGAEELHERLLTIYKSASRPEFTPFESLMETLAQSSRICRHYTQNIDCRSARLPSLAERTIWLHGRLDTLRCHIRPLHTKEVTLESFSQWDLKPCPTCVEINTERVNNNKRERSKGFLRTDVLLYDEQNPHDTEIHDAFDYDKQQPIDCILIVGTRLEIDDLRGFMEDLCHAAKEENREILTVWVNKEAQKHGQKFGSLIQYEYIGDCDEFASLVSANI